MSSENNILQYIEPKWESDNSLGVAQSVHKLYSGKKKTGGSLIIERRVFSVYQLAS